jgi:SpoVK/Ycf46/Vps4 family AAA+-type ATPase
MEIPAEIAPYTALEETGYPSESELMDLVSYVYNATGIEEVPDTHMEKVARAGAGLSEFSFIDIILTSMPAGELIDDKVVNKAKIALVRKHSSIDIYTPTVKMGDVGGLDLACQMLQDAAYLWNNPDKAREQDIEIIRRVLLVGVSGCGKSFLCEAAADALGLDLGRTAIGHVMDKHVGQSEANMRALWAQVYALAPITIWMDEIGRDLSGGASSGYVDAGTTDRVHAEFLTGLQQLPENIFLMAAANDLSQLPPEMLRAERFDRIMFVGFPTVDERAHIFRLNLPANRPWDLNRLALVTPEWTGAEIVSLIKLTKFKHMREDIPLTMDNLTTEADAFRNRVWLKHRSMIQAMYRRAMEEFEWASSTQLADARRIGYADSGVRASTARPKV